MSGNVSKGEGADNILLTIELLGSFSLKSATGKDVPLSSKKARCLLAYLSMNNSIRVTRKELAELLWCHQNERRARVSLRQCIRQLKVCLSKSLDGPVEELLQVDRQYIALNKNKVLVDWHQWLDGPSFLSAEQRKACLVKCRTNLLQGLVCDSPKFDDWLASQREFIFQKLLECLENSLVNLNQSGDVKEGAEFARNLISLDPCHEQAAFSLMTYYHKQGRDDRGLQVYRDLKDALKHHLDVEPDEKTCSFSLLLENSLARQKVSRMPLFDDGKPAAIRPCPEYRRILLQRVRSFWINGLLTRSLETNQVIDLQLVDCPRQVYQPWQSVACEDNPGKAGEMSVKDVAAIYEDADQSLLILGAPGAGKTTLLLKLLQRLIDCAEVDSQARIPVVFHLATWAETQQPLQTWLVEELNKRYGIPPTLGESIIETEVILLMDGLDEVPVESQDACIQSINHFLSQRVHSSIAVCCRQADYQRSQSLLKLNRAICIQPVTVEQQQCVLNRGHKVEPGTEQPLNESLKELATTPLMINMVASLFSRLELTGDLPPEDIKSCLFKSYVHKMLSREQAEPAYTEAQCQHYLSWLARQLIKKQQGVFYLEWMQAHWLSSVFGRWLVTSGSILFCGLSVGLVLGLYGGLTYGMHQSLAMALGLSLISSAIVAFMGAGQQIRPGTRVKFSYRVGRKRVMQKSAQALLVGALTGITFAYLTNWMVGAVAAIVFGGNAFIFSVLENHFVVASGKPHELPNTGMRKSIVSMLTIGPLAGLLMGALGWWYGGVAFGVFAAVESGLVMALIFGGHPVLQHYLLRFFLWRQGSTPKNYVDFLEYCSHHSLLYPVAGGYLFMHRSLMEYFASLGSNSDKVPTPHFVASPTDSN